MTDKKTKKVDAGFGNNKNYVPPEQLTDAPARLFRQITDRIGLNMSKWTSYMNEHLKAIHPDDSGSPLEVKKARGTSLGNANQAYFYSKGLSFNKLLEGLKIIRLRRVTIRLECEMESGETFDVSETCWLRPERNRKSNKGE